MFDPTYTMGKGLKGSWNKQKRSYQSTIERLGRKSTVPQTDEQNSLSSGDSIGILALLVGTFLVIFVPPLLFKAILLIAVLIGFVTFVFKSHWSGQWSVKTKSICASVILLVLGSLSVRQLVSEWEVAQRPEPAFTYFEQWGLGPGPFQFPTAYTHVTVDGKLLFRFHSKYRLVAGCFHTGSSALDPEDIALQKSEPYDIRNDSILVNIPLDSKFQREEITMRGSTYALLLVPKDVTSDQFSTIHQAEKLKALFIQGVTGPLP